MSTRTAPGRLSTTAGVEVCRLTVVGPDRRCDLALPVSAAIGELLPLVVGGPQRPGREPDPAGAWVVQRLGGPALDPGATPEGLGLRDGEVLYVNPAESVLPEARFDDVSVGVAQAVAARTDQWRPEFTRYLLLAAALVTGIAFSVAATGSHPYWITPLWYAVAAVGLTAWGAVAAVVFEDRVTGIAAGLAACAAGTLAGLAARHAATGLFTLDRRSLVLAALGAALPALVLAATGRLPLTLFGTVVGWGAAAAVGDALAAGLHWDATRAVTLLAVVVFGTGALDLRMVLRAARLRVPLLPRNAQELQEDIEPLTHDEITRRSAQAVGYLNILFLTAGPLTIVACARLVSWPGWIGWTLAGVLSAAVLLRARSLTLVWQRVPLALAGMCGLAAIAVSRAAGAGSTPRALLLAVLLLACGALLAAARRMPGRRLLPIWGHVSDLLETWTAVALVPLLLQLLHVYAYFRGLIH